MTQPVVFATVKQLGDGIAYTFHPFFYFKRSCLRKTCPALVPSKSTQPS
ncbi:hypothetical protein HanPSC8_Chr10g0417121 [Helianthus annuus]|nr:hypothetical protein HanPSC8_Chr10g0417121 [Helianthus annuus]